MMNINYIKSISILVACLIIIIVFVKREDFMPSSAVYVINKFFPPKDLFEPLLQDNYKDISNAKVVSYQIEPKYSYSYALGLKLNDKVLKSGYGQKEKYSFTGVISIEIFDGKNRVLSDTIDNYDNFTYFSNDMSFIENVELKLFTINSKKFKSNDARVVLKVINDDNVLLSLKENIEIYFAPSKKP